MQKAKVSWVRVRPYLKDIEETEQKVSPSATLSVSHVSFTYPGGDHPIYKDFNLEAKPGEFIGVTGKSPAEIDAGPHVPLRVPL